jgi:hypothetical protein
MINGNEYSWEDLQVVMLGRPLLGITGIEYKEEQTKTNIYGRGNKPVARTRGNKTYSGSLVILQSEYEALQATAGEGKSLNDLPRFDITVAYAAASGGVITTDVLRNVEFTDLTKALNQGDANMNVSLPLIIGSIDYNV